MDRVWAFGSRMVEPPGGPHRGRPQHRRGRARLARGAQRVRRCRPDHHGRRQAAGRGRLPPRLFRALHCRTRCLDRGPEQVRFPFFGRPHVLRDSRVVSVAWDRAAAQVCDRSTSEIKLGDGRPPLWSLTHARRSCASRYSRARPRRRAARRQGVSEARSSGCCQVRLRRVRPCLAGRAHQVAFRTCAHVHAELGRGSSSTMAAATTPVAEDATDLEAADNALFTAATGSAHAYARLCAPWLVTRITHTGHCVGAVPCAQPAAGGGHAPGASMHGLPGRPR